MGSAVQSEKLQFSSSLILVRTGQTTSSGPTGKRIGSTNFPLQRLAIPISGDFSLMQPNTYDGTKNHKSLCG